MVDHLHRVFLFEKILVFIGCKVLLNTKKSYKHVKRKFCMEQSLYTLPQKPGSLAKVDNFVPFLFCYVFLSIGEKTDISILF